LLELVRKLARHADWLVTPTPTLLCHDTLEFAPLKIVESKAAARRYLSWDLGICKSSRDANWVAEVSKVECR
tara:strand:- start:10655 stop:10870 length:216 start_codon:yes stop_codon:yes gene_type:complete